MQVKTTGSQKEAKRKRESSKEERETIFGKKSSLARTLLGEEKRKNATASDTSVKGSTAYGGRNKATELNLRPTSIFDSPRHSPRDQRRKRKKPILNDWLPQMRVKPRSRKEPVVHIYGKGVRSLR